MAMVARIVTIRLVTAVNTAAVNLLSESSEPGCGCSSPFRLAELPATRSSAFVTVTMLHGLRVKALTSVTWWARAAGVARCPTSPQVRANARVVINRFGRAFSKKREFMGIV